MFQKSYYVALVLPLVTIGCATGPDRVGEQTPTVSYSYETSEQAEEAQRDAEDYCYENYGRTAVIIDDRPDGGDRILTFECVANR